MSPSTCAGPTPVTRSPRVLQATAASHIPKRGPQIIPRTNGRGGRYIDASVDPATLQVMITGPGRWRAADRLSVGTAEQVYLLLRVALAQHLTTTDETCPLLLDDVTVQADDERAKQVLDLLRRLSENRQIVLFAQESTVAAWAAQNLTGKPEHLLLKLPQVTVE